MGFINNVNVDVRGAAHIAPCTYKTVVLKQNITKENLNVLTQAMLDEYNINTKFIIKWDYILKTDIIIPKNCILEFDGGSINGAYTITGQNTGIKAELVKIFSTDVTLAGTWNVAEAYPEWFGAKGDGITDCLSAFLKCNDIQSGTADISKITIKLGENKIYAVSDTIVLYEIDFNLNGSSIKAIEPTETLLELRGYEHSEDWEHHQWMCRVYGGRIDGNGNANICVKSNGVCLYMDNCVIANPVEIGICGTRSVFGFQRVSKCKIVVESGFIDNSVTTKAIFANVTDSTYNDIEIVDFNYGIFENVSSNNIYDSIRVWGYAIDLTKTTYAKLKYNSHLINPVIDTLAVGIEISDEFQSLVAVNMSIISNSTVWRQQVSEGAENDKFTLIKYTGGGYTGNTKLYILGGIADSLNRSVFNNGENFGNVFLVSIGFVNHNTRNTDGEKIITDNNSLMSNLVPSSKDANDLLTEGNYLFYDLTSWQHIPTDIKLAGYGAHLYVKRAGNHIWQYIKIVNIVSGNPRVVDSYERDGYITNNGTIWNIWAYIKKLSEYNKISGSTSNRPTSALFVGQSYFDTSLGTNGKPIWYAGKDESNNPIWVDATGATV